MEHLPWTLVIIFAVSFAVEATTDEYCHEFLVSGGLPKTCMDLRCKEFTRSGVYTVYPRGRAEYSLEVYCDQTTDSGGWTVFQRRMDGSVDFYRNWQNYKLGFGDVNGEHWLGNENLVELLNAHDTNELRVDLETVDNERAHAAYGVFSVSEESSHYTLTVSEYSGEAGDSLTAQSNGQKFTTRDVDNDTWGNNCAIRYHGAWWYKACHHANLNGDYLNGTHSSFADGINWHSFKGYGESMKTTEMKFRAKF
ncbi:fibrinogen C domain-containing protein 1-B-like isoform X2 [Watersipora subatra]|uniref:fibrinogen C domain-containing protein 1-B-like isoform X2 n=1 Tax=Watersipora subatra TaxID=2589382 RepID=UPI00355B2BD5